MKHSERQRETARTVREALYELESAADGEHLEMLGYLLRLAIVETDKIVGDKEPPKFLTVDPGRK